MVCTICIARYSVNNKISIARCFPFDNVNDYIMNSVFTLKEFLGRQKQIIPQFIVSVQAYLYGGHFNPLYGCNLM